MISEIIKKQGEINFSEPVLIFEKGNHKVYWLGMNVPDAFRTNIYLVVDGDEAVIVDPGNKSFFNILFNNLKKFNYKDKIIGGIFCHQDPDVAGSIADCVNNFDNFKVFTSSRTNILLPHYGVSNYEFYDAGDENDNKFIFKSGNELQFIEAHFLHFPGAIATYDPVSGFLFSGDVWASIDVEFRFVVSNFNSHIFKLNLFHLDYMSCSKAARGFVQKLKNYDIKAILPQHGAIIDTENVENALNYLNDLRCGIDLIYPDL